MLDFLKSVYNAWFGKRDDEFWIPKPRRFDFMTVAIMIPVVVSALGLFLMSIESFVFVQFGSLSMRFPELRAYIALASGVFLAFGGEVGSIANNVEIFSKYIKSKLDNTRYEWDIVTSWDWLGFFVSSLATVFSVIVASSTRELAGASWMEIAANWLILPMMILAVGDVVFGTIELGIRFGSYDARMTTWIELRKVEQERIEYLKTIGNAQIPVGGMVPLAEDNETSTLCWCGYGLKSELGYNRHVIVHKREAREFPTSKDAYEGLKERYADTIPYGNIEFPTLSDIVLWRKEDD